MNQRLKYDKTSKHKDIIIMLKDKLITTKVIMRIEGKT